nr:hypothetical protein [Tanacetum cinerariifolium]
MVAMWSTADGHVGLADGVVVMVVNGGWMEWCGKSKVCETMESCPSDNPSVKVKFLVVLYFTMCICPPRIFESAQCSFDVALRSSLERIIVASGPGFGDWQWRLATLPFSAGLQTKLLQHTSFVSPGPIFDDALSLFNTSMETDLLCNPNEIAASKVMKKMADIYFTWPCSRVFAEDIYGDHDVSSAGIIGIKHHHNVVRDTLVDICHRSGISVGKEVDIRLDGGHDKLLPLADMLLYSWDGGLMCVWI